MVRVEMARWGQTREDLRCLARQAAHPRTRERLLARFQIAEGSDNATSRAVRFRRQNGTVMKWVHSYNANGPDALAYRRTGSRPPFSPTTKPDKSSRPSPTPSPSITA